MFRSSISRWIIGMLAMIAVLGVARFKPWRSFIEATAERAQTRADLQVGYLPVT